MKIAVIGASGWLGGTIAREAVGRGHEVTAIGRDATRLSQVEGARAVVADLDDPGSIVDAVRGSDVVVSSVTDRSTPDRSRIPATARQLLGLAPRAGVHRVAFVGGGGSLQIEPGLRAVDAPGFPEQHKAEALAQAEALEVLRGSDGGVDWTLHEPATAPPGAGREDVGLPGPRRRPAGRQRRRGEPHHRRRLRGRVRRRARGGPLLPPAVHRRLLTSGGGPGDGKPLDPALEV